jgi:hypothetical protein
MPEILPLGWRITPGASFSGSENEVEGGMARETVPRSPVRGSDAEAAVVDKAGS